MLDAAINILACPHCGGTLHRQERTLTCAERHSFDLAKHGYVTLLRTSLRGVTGDTAEMVAARHEFLESGFYRPIQDAVAGSVAAHCGKDREAESFGPVIADVGAGSGDYLVATLDACPAALGVGIDVSKHAARRLARLHPQTCAIVADVWRQIPLKDGVCDAALSIFAPRNVSEVARVLRAGGQWIIVTPRPEHLLELTRVPGVVTVDEGKSGKLDASVGERFTLTGRRSITYRAALPLHAAELLIGMGPTAYHLDAEQRRAVVARLAPESDSRVDVSVAVDISVFTRN